MREIKFRGKRCSDGEWVYGSYLESNRSWAGHKPHKSWIVCSAFSNGGWLSLMGRYAVKDGTIGQFTRMLDVNGKNIYEGDIISCTLLDTEERIGVVRYHKGCFWFICINGYSDEYLYCMCNKTIIGNIHDNPELLESKS